MALYSHESETQASTTALGADESFTGPAEECHLYSQVNVSVWADRPGDLYLEFSIDGTNWDFSTLYAVAGSTGLAASQPTKAKFFRARYVNGSLAQTAFRLYTVYHVFKSGIAPTQLDDGSEGYPVTPGTPSEGQIGEEGWRVDTGLSAIIANRELQKKQNELLEKILEVLIEMADYQ